MSRFILNSAVITTPGRYEYVLISIEEAKAWLAAGEFKSTVRYSETAMVLHMLTGFEIPLSKETIALRPGDQALVFRLKYQPGTNRVEPGDKGKLTPEFVAGNCEIGMLKYIARPLRKGSGRVSGETHGRARLTRDQIAWAKQRRADGTPVVSIAKHLGVTISTIYKAFEGVSWKE